MAIKQITYPANPYAIINDHSYSKTGIVYTVLKSLDLMDTSKSDIQKLKKGLCFKVTAKLSIITGKSESPATVHGQIYEKVTVETFEKTYFKNVCKVVKCGLFVMLNHPYNGVSPEGLLGKNSLVEVKCPYTARYEYTAR